MHSIASVKILIFFCTVCNFVVHERCLKLVVSACSSIATTLIKNPVAHCFSTPSIFKRKFCDVCRKRLEDSAAIRCERKSDSYHQHLDFFALFFVLIQSESF